MFSKVQNVIREENNGAHHAVFLVCVAQGVAVAGGGASS
jgi:hypothetical protein